MAKLNHNLKKKAHIILGVGRCCMHMEHARTEIVILQLQKVQTKFNGNLRGALYRKPRVPSSHWFLK